MKSSKAIDPEIVEQYKKLMQQASVSENEISDRIHFVIEAILKVFDNQLDHWYFEDAPEGEIGDVLRNIHADYIGDLCIYPKKMSKFDATDLTFIDRDGIETDVRYQFPTRWLFDDSFEKELIEGKAKFEQREAEIKAKQKEKTAAQKAEDKKLVSEIKKKLSSKELAALRRSL